MALNLLSTQQVRSIFAIALFCIGAAAASGEEIKKNIPTGAKPSLLLRNQNGGISVKTWDQNEIEIKAKSSSDAVGVMIISTDQKVTVQTQAKGDMILPPTARVDFEIRVPHEAMVRVDSERGQVSIDNVQGDISIEGVSNSVLLSNLSGHITARTVDGPILFRACQGLIEAHSISGDLKFERVNATDMVASTNSGTITYEGDFGSAGHYTLTNNQSPINIKTSDKASFELTARAMRGSIESDIPLRPSPLGNQYRRLTPGRFLQGLFNGGNSTVQITSFSGTIRLQGPR